MINFPNRREVIISSAATVAVLIGTSALPAVPRAQPQNKVRRDVNELAPNDPILESYRRAVTAMRKLDVDEPENPLGWRQQAAIHDDFCPHENWFFLPWHRAYLGYFEDICRTLSGDEGFVLPYWNWTRNPQIPAAFWGDRNPLQHRRFANPQSTLASEFIGLRVIERVMRKPNFESFASLPSTRPRGGSGGGYGELEGLPHNSVHGFVGGDMRTLMSPLDPIFWLHHCNVDRIWASWNANNNANSADQALANFVLGGNFTDRSGASVDVKISDLYDTTSRGYEYDRLEPKPSPRIGGVLGPDMAFVPIGASSQRLAVMGEAGSPLSASVAVKSELLNSLATNLGKTAIKGAELAERPAELVTLRITGVHPPEDPRAYVRVFLNCPYLTEETPINDPHYVSTFTFFTDKAATHGEHGEERMTYAFDVTDTLDALRRSGRYPEGAIEPQLLAFGGDGRPKELKVDGGAELNFLRAERIQ